MNKINFLYKCNIYAFNNSPKKWFGFNCFFFKYTVYTEKYAPTVLSNTKKYK